MNRYSWIIGVLIFILGIPFTIIGLNQYSASATSYQQDPICSSTLTTNCFQTFPIIITNAALGYVGSGKSRYYADLVTFTLPSGEQQTIESDSGILFAYLHQEQTNGLLSQAGVTAYYYNGELAKLQDFRGHEAIPSQSPLAQLTIGLMVGIACFVTGIALIIFLRIKKHN